MSRGRLSNELYAIGERRVEVEPVHAPTVEEAAGELFFSTLRTSRAQTMAPGNEVVVDPVVASSDVELGREFM